MPTKLNNMGKPQNYIPAGNPGGGQWATSKGTNTFRLGSSQEKKTMDLNERKIRILLKRYGVEEEKIDNFIEDLNNFVDDDIILTKGVVEELRKTEEGKDLLIKAPTYQREELRKAIAEFLKSQK